MAPRGSASGTDPNITPYFASSGTRVARVRPAAPGGHPAMVGHTPRTLDWLAFLILVLTGFTACAEFGSYAFVHPITRRLPQREFIVVEQGLLTSFGRVMPILMPLTLIVATSYAISVWDDGGWIR